jgi:site-specific DNA recombinase
MSRKRALIYARISEDRTGAGVKVEDQEADCRDLADRLGLDVVEVFTDNDLTAHKGSKRYRTRPGYNDLLTAIRTGQGDVVLALHTDRLHRDVAELLEYIRACQDRDVPTRTVRAGDMDLSNATGRAVALTAAVWASAEVERAKERMRAARIHKTARGQWTGGRRTYGYAATGRSVVDEEAEVIRWAAGQVLAGVSLRAIAHDLNRRGVATSTGGRWVPEVLGRLLQRPRLAGLVVHKGIIVGTAEWPAILDEDTWRGVCAVLGDPARKSTTDTARKWLLSGLALCGVCGIAVRSTSAPGKAAGGQTLSAYMCRSGGHVFRNAVEVDDYIEAVIIERLSRPDASELLVPDQTADTSGLHLRDTALRARLDELGRLYGEGTIDAAQLAQATAAIRHQREEVTDQLAAASRGSVLAGVADALDPEVVWQGLDLSRKRAIVDVLIEVVILAAKPGQRRGRQQGESQFDPDSVRITWRR